MMFIIFTFVFLDYKKVFHEPYIFVYKADVQQFLSPKLKTSLCKPVVKPGFREWGQAVL